MSGQPGLPLCSSREVCSALKRAGFKKVRKAKGTHQAFRGVVGGRTRTATVPLGKKEIPRGTLDAILKQAGLTVDQFLRCLKRRL